MRWMLVLATALIALAVASERGTDPGFLLRATGVGLAGGFAGGLIAGAIGLISVPLIVIFLGFPVHLAVGTNLFQTIFTAAAGGLEHARLGNVNLRMAGPILVGAVLGAPLGAIVSVRQEETVLLWIFSIVLVVVAIRMAISSIQGPKGEQEGFHLAERMDTDARARVHGAVARVLSARVADKLALLARHPIEGTFKGHAYRIDPVTPAIVGLGVGFVAGLLGIGGGFLITPAIALLLNVPMHLAVGTGLVIITGNAVFGTLPHMLAGNVALLAGVLIALGGVLGAAAGSRLSDKLSERALYVLFTILLFLVAWRMAPL